MSSIGPTLKQARMASKLSLKEAANKSGLTDSKILRIENGAIKEPSASSIKSLCDLYGLSTVSVFLEAGWIGTKDLKDYQLVFKGVDSLSEEEKKHVQEEIDFIAKSREGKR